MPLRLDSESPDFETAFEALLVMKREVSEDVGQTVRAIIESVRADGDAALIRYSRQFDRVDLATLGPCASARPTSPPPKRRSGRKRWPALRLAHDRITSFHEKQRPENLRFTDPLGVDLGWRWTAIQAVGLYVPAAPRAIHPPS